jgi:hypothetical protein
MPHDSLLNRIRSEFLEMPGQRLTRVQAQRLYGINELQCQRALDTLVDTRFLCVKPDGTYARPPTVPTLRARIPRRQTSDPGSSR